MKILLYLEKTSKKKKKGNELSQSFGCIISFSDWLQILAQSSSECLLCPQNISQTHSEWVCRWVWENMKWCKRCKYCWKTMFITHAMTRTMSFPVLLRLGGLIFVKQHNGAIDVKRQHVKIFVLVRCYLFEAVMKRFQARGFDIF